MITVTHEINEALVFSDRILGLKEGKLVFDGKPKELVESSALKNLFDSEFITLDAPEGGRPLVFPKGKSQA